MAVMRWDPFGEVLRAQREVDRLLSRLGAFERGDDKGVWIPAIDVRRRGDDIVVHAEVPGIKPEDVTIELTDNVLTIKGERVLAEEKEDEGWLVRERSYGAFERTITLPEGVDPASITASYRDGILEVHVPKALEAARPKTTKIEVSGA